MHNNKTKIKQPLLVSCNHGHSAQKSQSTPLLFHPTLLNVTSLVKVLRKDFPANYGPFEAGDRMVQKPPYWRANCSLGQIIYRRIFIKIMTHLKLSLQEMLWPFNDHHQLKIELIEVTSRLTKFRSDWASP